MSNIFDWYYNLIGTTTNNNTKTINEFEATYQKFITSFAANAPIEVETAETAATSLSAESADVTSAVQAIIEKPAKKKKSK